MVPDTFISSLEKFSCETVSLTEELTPAHDLRRSFWVYGCDDFN